MNKKTSSVASCLQQALFGRYQKTNAVDGVTSRSTCRTWQRWQEGGAADEVVIEYVWPNAKGDRFSTYEIVLATGAMVQKNMITGKEREVRRLVCPD